MWDSSREVAVSALLVLGGSGCDVRQQGEHLVHQRVHLVLGRDLRVRPRREVEHIVRARPDRPDEVLLDDRELLVAALGLDLLRRPQAPVRGDRTKPTQWALLGVNEAVLVEGVGIASQWTLHGGCCLSCSGWVRAWCATKNVG